MRYKNGTAILLLVLFTSFTSILGKNLAYAYDVANKEIPVILMEKIDIAINCTTAELDVLSSVGSNNVSLVRLPPPADINREGLPDLLGIDVTFTRSSSVLTFVFNDTDAEKSKYLADSIKGSMEEAFNTSFVWDSTGIVEGHSYVRYISSGKSDLTGYLGWLMERCLAPDLGGFTNTFIPVSREENAFIKITAYRMGHVFIFVGYSAHMRTGAGPHEINVLDLLNVESLAPSPYSTLVYQDWFTSPKVEITVFSNESVSYVTSEPGTAVILPSSEKLVFPMPRGWYLTPANQLSPPHQLQAFFCFGNDLTPLKKLTFTFEGLIIPEIINITPTIILVLIASIIIAAKRRAAGSVQSLLRPFSKED